MTSRRGLLWAAVIGLALGAWLLSSITAGAQERPPVGFSALGWASYGLAGADVATTMWAVGHGAGEEANPALGPLADHPVAFGAVRLGGSVLVNEWTGHLYKTRPKTAIGLRIAFVALQAGVVAWNAKQVRQIQRGDTR